MPPTTAILRGLGRALVAVALAAVLFSATLTVASAHHRPDHQENCQGQGAKACEIPEVPWAAALPAAGIAVLAGYYLIQRRRGEAPSDA
jgi:hypothetical protein